MTAFQTVPLSKVARLFSGGTPRKTQPKLWDGRVPWLTPKDMGRWTGETDQSVATEAIGNGTRLAPAHSSFVAVRGMSLHTEIRVVFSDTPLTFNQDIKAVVANNGIDPHFLYYALLANRTQLLERVSAAGHGTGVLSTDRLVSLPIPDVPFEEQQMLANLLMGLDEKIELNQRLNEALEAMAQAIFRDWFVDFGPVRRKIEGATDPVAIMGGVTTDPARAAELAALFPDELGLEGLPEGWELRPLRDSLVLQRGFDLPKPDRTDGAYPVIAASGPNGMHNEYKVRAPGVCTGRSGVLGNVFLVHQDFWPLNTSLWVKEFPRSTPIYAYHLLRGLDLQSYNAGSAVPTLNRNHVHEVNVVTPPMPAIARFDDLAASLYQLVDHNLSENLTLVDSRDYLLPRLMSGEVRIWEAEARKQAAE
ncbi:restriction endonuclease subunit S [Kaistia algarum]|uniref:restriction endonuclease subunit S n=1 Tax=Kaistia algarum TaxID=2083279 RepID=UPI000CE750B0|nr:restriction endonuclease subunit S [Kaistia algarum]MCX5513749.1 restriction endonuclease subunit S [Kaistia algarum]PPE79381.1 restriction endonuclease subunit S [Kaistia algarum]